MIGKRKAGIARCLLFFSIIISVSTPVQAKVALNRQKAALYVGSTTQLKLNGTKKKVVWGSTKPSVASVSKKGLVKAKKKGEAVITATIGERAYVCNITVKNKENVDVASEYALDATHEGDATHYDLDSGGASNLDDFGKKYLTAAMNERDYMNGLAGAYVEVTDKDGDKVEVLITDILPEGKKGDIDLTRKAFKKIEPLVTGRMKVTWKIIPFPTEDPVSFLWKPSSSQYWAEVQVRGHRYPIRSLEYYDESAKAYKELERKSYNYFAAPTGMGSTGPFDFRITDFYGQVIIEKEIKMKTNGKAVKGKSNFPLLEEKQQNNNANNKG